MKGALSVVPHPTGSWLIRAGGAVYAVPADLARPFLGFSGRCPSAAEWDGLVAPTGIEAGHWREFIAALRHSLLDHESGVARRMSAPVWLRLPLLPAAWVRCLAARLAPVAGNRGLIVMTATGLVGYGHLLQTVAAGPVPLTPPTVALAIALFGLTALGHELGHAAAVARSGYPAGGIGAGLLFVVPVLFADVTAVGVLPKRERARVDLAGVVFQFGLGGTLGLVAGLFAGCAGAAWLAALAIGWSLFPFIHADGYWLLCDLMDLNELERDPVPPPRGTVRWFLAGYRLLNALFLLAVGFFLPVRFAELGTRLLTGLGMGWPDTPLRPVLLVLAATVLALAWWNILRRVWRLVRAIPGSRG